MGELPREIEDLLYDPQTSGGLLIALPESDAAELEGVLPGAYRIGRVVTRGVKPIVTRSHGLRRIEYTQ
jgi:selenide,water dikinase